MALSNNGMDDLLILLEDINVKQSYSVLIRIKEVPPELTDVKKEAACALNALTELELYHVLQNLKKQFSEDDWDTLVN